MEDTEINLCDTCQYWQPECLLDMYEDDIEYGDGFGNDNIIKCKIYTREV